MDSERLTDRPSERFYRENSLDDASLDDRNSEAKELIPGPPPLPSDVVADVPKNASARKIDSLLKDGPMSLWEITVDVSEHDKRTARVISYRKNPVHVLSEFFSLIESIKSSSELHGSSASLLGTMKPERLK